MRNKVLLIGYVGNEIKLKKFESGKINVTLSLATNERYKKSSGQVIEDTQWHTVVAWGNLAKHLDKYVSVGDEIGIEGKLTSRSYINKEQLKVNITEVIVKEITFFNVKKIKKLEKN